jgi:hypothetical protein
MIGNSNEITQTPGFSALPPPLCYQPSMIRSFDISFLRKTLSNIKTVQNVYYLLNLNPIISKFQMKCTLSSADKEMKSRQNQHSQSCRLEGGSAGHERFIILVAYVIRTQAMSKRFNTSSSTCCLSGSIEGFATLFKVSRNLNINMIT